MRRLRSAHVAALLAAAALAGCSPSNQDAIAAEALTEATLNDPRIPIGPGGEVSVTAFDLGFRDLSGVAVDGPVTFVLDNQGEALHNVVIDEGAVDEDHPEPKVEAAGGETATGDILLFGSADGTTYTYYCDVPGHRSAGMVGQIIVYATPEDAAGQPLTPEG